MTAAQMPTAVREPGEAPKARVRRVVSERSARRRESLRPTLLEHIVVPEDAEGLTQQANSIYYAFKPRNAWQDWLTSEISTLMVRINRCSRIERRLRDLAAYRSIDFWEDDQQVEVETLALRITRQPGKTVAKLRLTPAGCDWLLSRWRFLAKTDTNAWTDAQRAMAVDLVGADPSIDPAAPGLAAERVADLEVQRRRVEEADEIMRQMVEADLTDDIPNLSRLRRYSRSLHRQMKYYIDQFHVEHPDRWDDPNRKPGFVAQKFIDRENAREHTWTFAEPERPTDETNPPSVQTPKPAFAETKPLSPATPEPEISETKPSSPEPTHRNAETKPLKPIHLMTADEIEAHLPPEALVCHDYSNERLKTVERTRRTDPVRDANQRGKLAKRRASLASLGV